MEGSGILFIVLLIIYLFDCLTLGRSDCFFFRRLLGGDWIQISPKSFPIFSYYAVLFKGLLPSIGSVALSPRFPFSVTASALGSNDIATAAFRPSALIQTQFHDLRQVSCDGKSVLGDGRVLAHAASEPYAQWLVSVIDKIQKSPVHEREAEIERQVAQTFDIEAVARRRAECEEAVSMLRPTSLVLATLLFLIAPSITSVWGILRVWPLLLSMVFGNSLLVAFLFWKAHQRIYPSFVASRITTSVTLFLSPPAAIRAEDLISKDAFCAWHPLAIASTLCNRATASKLAEQVLRETLFTGRLGAVPATCDHWHSVTLCHLDRAISRLGLKKSKLLRAPVRQSARCTHYCPRCLSQYTGNFELCSDCFVGLSSF